MKNFELIYEEFHIPIYKYLMRLTGDELLSEELMQETFYQAYKSILRYNGKSTLFTWLCAIAKNCYFKYLRKDKQKLMNVELLEQELMADEYEEQERVIEKKETVSEIATILMGMKKIYRDVIIMRVYFECSYNELSRVLGISESAAKVRYHRGIEILKKTYADKFSCLLK